MKKTDLTYMNRTVISSLFILLLMAGCERSVDGLSEPGLTENPEVFADGFSSGLQYQPFAGSKLDAFTVDEETTFGNGGSSMRFDVPNVGDPTGAYAGAIFSDGNGGRDLSQYDALTFYAKATTAGTINDIGFGQDFGENKYQVAISGLKLSTNWKKYVIPIPDPSKLTAEAGLFWYAEGPEDGNGYTFWIDELKYETLGNIAQPRPAILGSSDVEITSFIGSGTTITGLTQTFNTVVDLPDGSTTAQDVTLTAAPGYFTFSSSNPSIATVNENGVVSVVGEGTTVITASLDGIEASGSLSIESLGEFTAAPSPAQDAEDVISIFSDAYDNVPVSFYNGFYEPFQTTTSNDFSVNGDNVLNYENYNFVGIEFNPNAFGNGVPTIDGSKMTDIHFDIFVPDDIPAGSNIRINLRDYGADNAFDGGDDSIVSFVLNAASTPALVAGQWLSIDFDITGLDTRANLGQIVLDAVGNNDPRPSNFYVDNIYLYNDGTVFPDDLNLPITFDDPSVTYGFSMFNGATSEIVANPEQSGSNTSASNVGAITNSGVNWEGGTLSLDNPVDFSTQKTITIDVWSDDAVPVLLKFEQGVGGAPNIEVAQNHSGSGWEELSFTFSSSDSYGLLVLFMDGPGTTSGVFYVDNIAQN